MFQIIKEAYACSLAPGVKIPSYCKNIQPDCSCITADGRVIPVDTWGSINVEIIASMFSLMLKNPISLAIFLVFNNIIIFDNLI